MTIEPLSVNDGLDAVDTREGTIVIDADTLVYSSCVELEVKEEQLPESFHTPQEWQEIVSHPHYWEEEHAIYTIDHDLVIDRIKERVEEIRNKSDSKEVFLLFSPDRTFRNDLYPGYKDNRKRYRRPAGLVWAKQAILEHYPARICKGWEADDEMVFLAREMNMKCASVDKDCIHSVPRCFDYYHSRMQWVETPLEYSRKWPYIQCLAGDSSDGIKGVPGIGIKRAEKLLEDLSHPWDLWQAVVAAYREKGLEEDEALLNMRLVNMMQLKDMDGQMQIVLWNPPANPKRKETK